jgi:hypothetical protein
MMLHRHRHVLEPVYVRGSHEEFMDAINEKLQGVMEPHAPVDSLEINNVSHALAIAPDGEMHWSALLSIDVDVTEES